MKYRPNTITVLVSRAEQLQLQFTQVTFLSNIWDINPPDLIHIVTSGFAFWKMWCAAHRALFIHNSAGGNIFTIWTHMHTHTSVPVSVGGTDETHRANVGGLQDMVQTVGLVWLCHRTTWCSWGWIQRDQTASNTATNEEEKRIREEMMLLCQWTGQLVNFICLASFIQEMHFKVLYNRINDMHQVLHMTRT